MGGMDSSLSVGLAGFALARKGAGDVEIPRWDGDSR